MSPYRLATSLLALALALPAIAQDSAADRFKNLYEREWAWRQQESPQLASYLGDHSRGGELGHVDEKSQLRRLKDLQAFQRELEAISPDQLSAADKINYAIYRAQLANRIGGIQVKDYLLPMTSDSSFYADLMQMPESQPLKTAADYRTYIAKLKAIPAYFDEHIVLLKQGVKIGMTLPQVVLQGRDGPLREVAENKDLAKNPFYQPFAKLPATINADEAAALRRDGEEAVRKHVVPAYARLLKYFVDDYVPHARKTLGAYQLPNGQAYYQQQIREYTTLESTPEEIHQIGLKEVARIRAEMEKVMKDAKFDGDFAAFLTFLRTDPQFYAKTPRELLMIARDIAKRIDAELPKYFGKLPRLPYGVAPVPAAIAPYYTTGRYSGAPADGKTAGFYWVNTWKLEARPLYALPALTLHEAVPGHHLQGALANEQGEQPPFRRYSYISAFGEGWALYAEHLGVEMGIYETPYEQFGRLTYEMWRACRLVIDTGIHAKGWSREQALALLRDNSALSEHEITTEVDRYISWPGQALSYKLGELRIRELRADAEREMGDKFDLRAFHDAILSLGSVPLPLLDQRVKAFIHEGK
ncbi:uncharacterized protein (DUF885 family) [Tahibacter aquaticus]|uniref:Uncharacterized protein (DUF885 family) n=1 Tax=Tahibacter aquaticus TaxID=520092 RepID=A0A4R6Z6Z0_9GAMM|nr:DUF885 domain-containing protein [Tahibacter aquaticus]TDR47548.1 uncharacterized protein (DUF885 family) [Tahibacter aquaticus]